MTVKSSDMTSAIVKDRVALFLVFVIFKVALTQLGSYSTFCRQCIRFITAFCSLALQNVLSDR